MRHAQCDMLRASRFMRHESCALRLASSFTRCVAYVMRDARCFTLRASNATRHAPCAMRHVPCVMRAVNCVKFQSRELFAARGCKSIARALKQRVRNPQTLLTISAQSFRPRRLICGFRKIYKVCISIMNVNGHIKGKLSKVICNCEECRIMAIGISNMNWHCNISNAHSILNKQLILTHSFVPIQEKSK